jgi:D-glycero-alpha-D-manno-heptose-7-phosphate kinase
LKAEAVQMKEAILRGDLDPVVTAVQVSWEAKKQMASSISNEHIEGIYAAARKAGARAGKISGAGGGGFMMFMVDPVERARVISCLRELSGSVSTCNFVEEAAHSWRVTRER